MVCSSYPYHHRFNGCKCMRCGETRDEGHSFVKLEGKCMQQCSVCGKIEEARHDYVESCPSSIPHFLDTNYLEEGRELDERFTAFKCKNCGQYITDYFNDY